MEECHIFISVGAIANASQEDFICAVEDRLRGEGFIPHTIGRNTFSSDAPLMAVLELYKKCSGAVVIALERSYYPSGISKRGGPDQTTLTDIMLPTPWNHIEATIAYTLKVPLMVIVERGILKEGLLEPGYDWFVQELKMERAALTSVEFSGIFASWRQKVLDKSISSVTAKKTKSIDEMNVVELFGSLKPGTLWTIVGVIGTIIVLATKAATRLHWFQ